MSLDVWIYCKPAEWDALTGPEVDGEPTAFSTAHTKAITGFWKPFTGGYEVYNTEGSAEQIQEVLDALSDVAHVFAWGQGNGTDSLDQWPTDPSKILAVMKDHVTYNEDGTVASTTPATLDNPNWGHWFLGQTGRIFAGDFTTDFNGDFL